MRVLQNGDRLSSPGMSFNYRIVGAICRLYDRGELPYPSCSMQWKGKQPSWNRVGKRFVPDMACKRSPSYMVQAWDGDRWCKPEAITFYNIKLTPEEKAWWITEKKKEQKLNETNYRFTTGSTASDRAVDTRTTITA